MKKIMKKGTNWKLYFRIAIVSLLLYSFYNLGFSLYVITILGAFFILLMLLKGTLYGRIDRLLIKKFPFLSKEKVWLRKLIVILSFILSYFLIKQIIFFVLRQLGVNIQEIILNSLTPTSLD